MRPLYIGWKKPALGVIMRRERGHPVTFLEQLQETGVTDSLQVNDQQIVSLAILLSSQGEQNTGSDVTSNPQSASCSSIENI